MNILAIETSCDETAVALLECSGDVSAPEFNVLGNTLLSQASKHAEYGGVYPSLAKREHSRNLIPLLQKTLEEAGFAKVKSKVKNKKLQNDTISSTLEREPELLEQFLEYIPSIEKPDIDAIAVTQGPGLEPALWVGLNFAKALSLVWNVPLIPVNHMEGHITSVLISTEKKLNPKSKTLNMTFPAVALLISGGHTELVLVKNWGEYELIGRTRDDAVGEAFDKVARMLGLSYPGGPEIGKLALSAEENHIIPEDHGITLPRPMLHSGDYDFSFSGLKTAVLYRVQEHGELSEELKAAFARAFEEAVTEILVTKTERALEEYGAKTLIIGGGVIASRALRKAFRGLAQRDTGLTLSIPEQLLTTDNALMIGIAGFLTHLRKQHDFSVFSSNQDLAANGNLSLHSI